MSFLWVLLLTLLVCRNQAEDQNFKDELERKHCPSESCSPNASPLPMVQREKQSLRDPDEDKSIEEKLNELILMDFNFTCADKPYIPGFYADMESDCKTFHICKKTIVEHYLCLPGSLFDQKTMRCKPEDEVKCHLSPAYYAENKNFPVGHPVFQRKDFYMDQFKWLANLAETALKINDDPLELNFIKLLISLRLVSVANVPAGILDAEPHGADWEARAREFLDSSKLRSVMNTNLHKMFPHPPLMFGHDSRAVSEQPDSIKLSKRVSRSSSDQGSSKVQMNLDVPKPNGRTAKDVIELIVDSIGATADRILSSRSYLLSEYIRGFLRKIASTTAQ